MGRAFRFLGRWVGEYVGSMCAFAAMVALGAATMGTDGVFGTYLNAFGMTFIVILLVGATQVGGPITDILLSVGCTRRRAYAGFQLALAAGCAVSMAATLAMGRLAVALDERYMKLKVPLLVLAGLMVLAAETGAVMARLQGMGKKAALGVPMVIAALVGYIAGMFLEGSWAGLALGAGLLAAGLALAAVNWRQMRRAAL